ncbi:MAG: hypothetical protein ACK5LK_04045 [Chthoniobacterales bacterium]
MQKNPFKDDFNDDELWEILGKSQHPKPSSNFTDRVMNEIQYLEKNIKKPAHFSPFFAWWGEAFSGTPARLVVVSCVLLTAAILFALNDSPASKNIAFNKNIPNSLTADFDLILDLDSLIASEEQNLWLDYQTF